MKRIHPFGSNRRPRSSLLLLMLVLLASLASGSYALDADPDFERELARYDYRDTRKLVRAVRSAAQLIERQGTNAFSVMKTSPKIWNNDLFYVYVYAMDGFCLYHPASPEFEGKNLLEVADADGRLALRMAMDAVNDPDNPHGWLHYLWHPAGGFNPVPKSSCHFLATMPDGRAVLAGGGMEYPPEERMFAQYAVDAAVRLLAEKGAAGIADVTRPATKYRFRDVKVFVMDEAGNALVDPALDSIASRNLASFHDAAGHAPFGQIVRKLHDADRCWEVMLSKNRYERVMEKKVVYARRGSMDGTNVIVGAATTLPKPIWSK